jgi:predicted Zn-dependent peptidase
MCKFCLDREYGDYTVDEWYANRQHRMEELINQRVDDEIKEAKERLLEKNRALLGEMELDEESIDIIANLYNEFNVEFKSKKE